MDKCFCGRNLVDGDRRHDIAIRTDWGAQDEREPHSKTAAFHSFKCLSDWATELAANHDNRVLVSGDPDNPSPAESPRVDTTTDTLIRKD